ncbi:biotin transporter BioY [Eggerthella sinensis]|uniref:biotin transporter BioY n=1 Tax=Eggerthella sinensis TaxID=242230 RepID=UPI001D07DBF3|nr:biotin transporter BioY [Eggerthella sinensis]MCB7039198.1 biotin transporter BioY [Eggerthella sinensis]
MEASKVKQGSMGASRTRSIAFVGLTITIMGVSAWVAIPFGPVLLTLQMFALMFAIMVLTPKQCMAAILGYLVLGAIGLPMFSGMRGGVGMLAGPTGGYLWGYVLGALAALAVRAALRRVTGGEAQKTVGPRAFAIDMAACLAFIVITYVCGCFQYALVTGVDLAAAFAVTIAPFAIPDVLKAVAAVLCAQAVKRALPKR